MDDVADKLLDKINKWKISGVGFDSLSNVIYSDYNYQKYYSKGNMGKDVSGIINKFKKSGKSVMTNNSNAYAAVVSDVILDVPVQSSRHDLFNTDVPFYEMVFRGYIPMYSQSFNLSNMQEEMLLRSIESGSKLSFTVMKHFTNELRSEFDFFHSTCYDDLKKDIIKNYNDTKEYFEKINSCEIIDHKLISETLHQTTFENGITVYVNFGNEAVDTPLGKVKKHSYCYG